MPTLISPGVSVSVTDESLYIPSSDQALVPLILLATAENKKQTDGVSVALGTTEHNVIRTVTSIQQSLQLYGIPRFLQNVAGEQFHGDSRNEYGLLALNKYLGVGSRAFVVRANINLNDNRDDLLDMWSEQVELAATDLQLLVQSYINEYNNANGYVSGNPNFKVTVDRTELLSLIEQVLEPVYNIYNFGSDTFQDKFFDNHNSSVGGDASLPIYNSSFTTVVGQYMGIVGHAIDWELNTLGGVTGFEDQWSPSEANNFLLDASDDFAFTVEFLNSTSLGANDAARRSAIVTALQATAALPELRSEAFEFNVVLCPGYYELVDDLVALAIDVQNEAFVLADTPMNRDPDSTVTWATSSSMGRVFSNQVAYYYSHGITSNLDGVDVLLPASAIALRTIAVSDNQSYVWFAPAGAQRGVVSGVSRMGYYTGTPGTPTKFIEATLNQGMRDNLYKDGTNVNPITFLPGRGILVFGNKTSASITSALDRINVVRLLTYIRRAIRKNLFGFLFEPNDQLTRNNVKTVVETFLNNILVLRGLYDFAVLVDESNNTPDRIDRNELWVDIAIKPVKSVEFIYAPIRVVSTGAQI